MCKLCEKNPVYEFTNKRKVCKNCFLHWFEKKVFFTIRKFGMISREDIISCKKSNDFRSAVLEEVLRIFRKRCGVEISKGEKYSKLAVSDTSDVEAHEITREIIKGKLDLEKNAPVVGKNIKPLYLFLDAEVLLYAKLKNLKFKQEKIKEDKIDNFLDEMEKKHPELNHSIVNSYLELRT